MKNLFVISDLDVQYLAQRKLGRKLSIEEIDDVQSGIEFGLECWEDVVNAAINEVESSKKRRRQDAKLSKFQKEIIKK